MSTSGMKRQRKIQLGREATAGTAVPATTIWRGPAVGADDERVSVIPDEDIGISAAITRQITPGLLASVSFPESVATFEQQQHIYESGVKTVSPVKDGVGSGYVSAYPLSYTDGNTLKNYTIETGDNKIEEEVEYAFTSEFTLSGKINEPIKSVHKMIGRQALVTSYTGGLSVPAVHEMLFNKSKLYIDNVGGTLGGTQIASTWLGFTLKVITGYKAQFTGDGNLYFSHVDFIGAKATLELELLKNATSAAERVLWRANTPRQIRIKTEGDALATSGTTYSKFTHLADCAGIYTAFGPGNDENDGSNVYKAMLELGYDATAALFLQLTTVNELSAVP